MDARKTRKMIGWSSLFLVGIIGLIFFWQPLYEGWMSRAFAEGEIRKFENMFLAGEHIGKKLKEAPPRSGKVLIVKPTVWSVYRVGNVFSTSITPNQQGKKDHVLSPPRVDEHWFLLDGDVRASTPDEVGTVIFMEYISRKAGNYVPVDSSTPSGGYAALRKSARMKFFDVASKKYLGQYVLFGNEPDAFATDLSSHSGDLPDIVQFVNEMREK